MPYHCGAGLGLPSTPRWLRVCCPAGKETTYQQLFVELTPCTQLSMVSRPGPPFQRGPARCPQRLRPRLQRQGHHFGRTRRGESRSKTQTTQRSHRRSCCADRGHHGARRAGHEPQRGRQGILSTSFRVQECRERMERSCSATNAPVYAGACGGPALAEMRSRAAATRRLAGREHGEFLEESTVLRGGEGVKLRRDILLRAHGTLFPSKPCAGLFTPSQR